MTRRHRRARTVQPMLALSGSATFTLAALLVSRPHLHGTPTAWSADDLAITGIWWTAVAASAWLAVTTFACVAALARGRTATAHRLARWAPPIARRVLQAALVGTWALVPVAAYAAPASAPIVVHVGADGHLTTPTGRSGGSDTPVVRAPASTTSTTSTTLPPRSIVTAPPAPRHAPAAPRPAHHSPAALHHSPRAHHGASRVHVVRPGDNLWNIARAEVARASGGRAPDDTHIATYWQRVIAANRATLRSGDPSLIFPGEIVTLPPVTL